MVESGLDLDKTRSSDGGPGSASVSQDPRSWPPRDGTRVCDSTTSFVLVQQTDRQFTLQPHAEGCLFDLALLYQGNSQTMEPHLSFLKHQASGLQL